VTASLGIEEARAALSGYSFRFGTELELQDGIARALTDRGVSFRREVVLSKRDRIDFMLDDGIGVEVKIDGSVSALTRQVFRYAELPDIRGLLVVVSAIRLANLPSQIGTKPVSCFRVMRAFQ
jgi:hypothetical protein